MTLEIALVALTIVVIVAAVVILWTHRQWWKAEMQLMENTLDADIHRLWDSLSRHKSQAAEDAHPASDLGHANPMTPVPPGGVSTVLDPVNAPAPYVQSDGSPVGVSKDGTAIPQPTDLISRIANNDRIAIGEGLIKGGAVTGNTAAMYAARLALDGASFTPNRELVFLKSLPALSLAMVKNSFLSPGGLFAPDQAGYDANRATPEQCAKYAAIWAGIETQIATSLF